MAESRTKIENVQDEPEICYHSREQESHQKALVFSLGLRNQHE